MKIIQVIPNLRRGGAETMCTILSIELCHKGHDVIIISLYKEETPLVERLKAKGIRIIFLNKRHKIDPKIVLEMKQIFKNEKPDVIHSHIGAIQYAMPAAILAKIKMKVHTIHNLAEKELSKPARFFAKIFYKYFNVTPIALSQIVQESVVKTYRLKREKVPIIYNGIDLSNCIKKDNYSMINDRFTILHIGRFAPQKNHKGLLEAFLLFHKTHLDSRLQLIGIGSELEEARRFVLENGLSNCVEFLGEKDDVYPYLHEADIFVLPSIYEGMPLVLIEAMGTGLPIVATNVGGIPDMLNHENSIIVPVDVNAIEKAFEHYYEDEAFRKHCGERVKERARCFSSQVMAEKYEELYES